jgi:hypothetical protein
VQLWQHQWLKGQQQQHQKLVPLPASPGAHSLLALHRPQWPPLWLEQGMLLPPAAAVPQRPPVGLPQRQGLPRAHALHDCRCHWRLVRFLLGVRPW